MAQNNNPVVLVVEDDPPVRELLQDVLQDEGYEVVSAHDGMMALQVLSSLKVDLITLDLDMPGLTGSELITVLRTRKIKMPPIVVVTGKSPVKRAIKTMAQAIVLKPFDIDELITAVLALLPRELPHAEQRLKEIVQAKHEQREAGNERNKPAGQNGSKRSRTVGTEDTTDAEDEP